MSRLIDTDLLKKNIAKWLQGSDPQETEMVKLDDIAVSVIMEIDEQPTAYDIEKVVAEIKKIHCKKCRNILGVAGAEEYCKEQKCRIDEICDIVRKGGVECIK